MTVKWNSSFIQKYLQGQILFPFPVLSCMQYVLNYTCKINKLIDDQKSQLWED